MMSLDWILLGLRLLATAILYAFLGLAFYLIWRDLRQAQTQIVPPQVTDQLRVIAATEGQLLVVGQTLPLQPAMLLGCGPENIVVVDNAARLTRCARLSQKDSEWWLEDLADQNGIKLNNLPLLEPAALSHGDIIEIGNVCFRIEIVNK